MFFVKYLPFYQSPNITIYYFKDPAYLLTTAGKELYNVLYASRNGEKVDETYLQEFIGSLDEYHLDKRDRIVRLEFTVHHNKK